MPILSIRALLSRNLCGSIDPRVVDGLLTSYDKLIARFRKGDLDGSLSEARKFVEHVLRAVEYVRLGEAPAEIKAPYETIKEIEKDNRLPEALRLLIPRITHAMIYDIRSKRGAFYLKEIDPKQIDAALSAQAASWVLAEFIRLYHDSDEAVVSHAMRVLMRPHVPFIEQFGNERVVTKKVPCDIELLLLLAREAFEGLDRTALGQSSKYPPSTVTNAITRMQKERHAHRTQDGRYHITGSGEDYLAEHLRS